VVGSGRQWSAASVNSAYLLDASAVFQACHDKARALVESCMLPSINGLVLLLSVSLSYKSG
jgi:hypothetical protein